MLFHHVLWSFASIPPNRAPDGDTLEALAKKRDYLFNKIQFYLEKGEEDDQKEKAFSLACDLLLAFSPKLESTVFQPLAYTPSKKLQANLVTYFEENQSSSGKPYNLSCTAANFACCR